MIFDIGSRDCIQSIEFYNNFPNSKIYAFECNPNTLDICRKNIENYRDRITLIEGAVCDYNGNITFYPINQQKSITNWADGNPGASSLYKSNGKFIETYIQDEVNVNCHRLDTIMDKYNIPKVDIIWMDLQGAELIALKGLGNYFKFVKYIHTEVSYQEIYTGQVMFNKLNEYIISNGFVIKNNNKLSFSGWQEDVIYKKEQFDIVICVGPNDKDIIYRQIEYTKKNVIGYRNIYLISDGIHIDGCISINENIFPFNLHTVRNIHGHLTRNAWYFQQLLKLYSLIVIPNILERCLVIDADTFFLKPTEFVKNDKCLYNFASYYTIHYFEHMYNLDKDLVKVDKDKSGITHHMIFEKKYIIELINKVEKNHNDTFYNVFIKMVPKSEYSASGASEYEIYFNYMLKNHSDKIELRKLNFIDTNNINDIYSNFDYVSYHWYNR